MATSATTAITATTATTAVSSAVGAAQNDLKATCVIWGLVYLRDTEDCILDKTGDDVYKKRKLARGKGKAAAKYTQNDGGDDEDSDDDSDDIPNVHHLKPQDKLLKTIDISPINATAILLPSGERIELKTGDDKIHFLASKPPKPTKPERTKRPRISAASLRWAPIGVKGASYGNVNAREGIVPSRVGPVRNSEALLCDPARDIFVFDRHALACIERPNGTDKNICVDIFGRKSTSRAEHNREVIEDFLLRPRNVAFNLSDPGSHLIYIDLLARATRSNNDAIRELLDQERSIAFFSSPDQCDHEDCEAWRVNRKSMRILGAETILGRKWWALSDFCVRDVSTLSFRTVMHSRDVARRAENAEEDVRESRAWAYAMVNHAPCEEGYMMAEGELTFPLLVYVDGNCLDVGSKMFANLTARAAMENPDECVLCQTECYGLTPLHHPVFGPGYHSKMFLHYTEDQNSQTQNGQSNASMNGSAKRAAPSGGIGSPAKASAPEQDSQDEISDATQNAEENEVTEDAEDTECAVGAETAETAGGNGGNGGDNAPGRPQAYVQDDEFDYYGVSDEEERNDPTYHDDGNEEEDEYDPPYDINDLYRTPESSGAADEYTDASDAQ